MLRADAPIMIPLVAKTYQGVTALTVRVHWDCCKTAHVSRPRVNRIRVLMSSRQRIAALSNSGTA
jgi:hypothetical protein